jgi:hypothetical protein
LQGRTREGEGAVAVQREKARVFPGGSKGIYLGEEGHALGVGARHVTDREELVSCVLLYGKMTKREKGESISLALKETGPGKRLGLKDKATDFISVLIKINRFAPKQMMERRKSFANIFQNMILM